MILIKFKPSRSVGKINRYNLKWRAHIFDRLMANPRIENSKRNMYLNKDEKTNTLHVFFFDEVKNNLPGINRRSIIYYLCILEWNIIAFVWSSMIIIHTVDSGLFTLFFQKSYPVIKTSPPAYCINNSFIIKLWFNYKKKGYDFDGYLWWLHSWDFCHLILYNM